ncbi:EF-hand domain-containing protein [Streptomyces sp. TS71-3]|uniref:EF-hand domain-containing protein n=1 Tax=Streptomyces sp. TS71-3 TaxID=2733862 RepID=UPI001B0DC3C1|nr:EF-hand domain-containing protein [Streptomyces sp. TS71-3]GHJ35648.1 calcium-binding protein [Streptomyces sp. TS71-3]
MAGIETARTVFDSFDVNKDGFLTSAEFQQVMKELGAADLTLEQAQALLDRQDADGDGTVSFEEFWAAYQRSGRA